MIYYLYYGNIEITMVAIEKAENIKRELDCVSIKAKLNDRKVSIEKYKGCGLIPRSSTSYPDCAFKAYRILANEYNRIFQKNLDSLIKPTFKHPKDKYRVACFFYNELVKTFDSIQDAATQLRLNYTDIRRVCEVNERSRKTCGGYVWRYVDGDCRVIEPWLIVDNYKGDEKYFRGMPTRIEDLGYIPSAIRKDMLEDKDMSKSILEMDSTRRKVRIDQLNKERTERDIKDFVENIPSNGKRMKCLYRTGDEEFYHAADYSGVIYARIRYFNKTIEVRYTSFDSNDHYSYNAKKESISDDFKRRFGKFSEWSLILL